MIDQEFLQLFEALKTAQKQQIEQVSNKILATLLADEHNKKDQKKDFTRRPEDMAMYGANLAYLLRYALRRLINALISTNPIAQFNFNYCLIQVLKAYKSQIDARALIDVVMEKSNKKEAINKTEINMFAVGRSYFFNALAKSQVLEAKSDCEQQLEYVFQILFDDFQAYPFLQEGILENIRLFLNSRVAFAKKIKILINKGKFLLPINNFVSIEYLTILFLACEREKQTFSYAQNLQDKIFNHKNLLKSIQDEFQNFPRKSLGYSNIIKYITYACKGNESRKKEIWENFFQFLLKDLKDEHKNYFIILNFLNQFLKNATISDLQYIAIDDLIHLWQKNLQVMNPNLKKVAVKIENKLVKMTSQKIEDKSINNQEQQILENLLQIMKKQTSHNFTNKSKLALNLFTLLNKEQINDYYKFLKKQLHQSQDPIDRKYYLNEIYILGDVLYEQLSQDLFLEIIFLLFEQSNLAKLKLVFEQIPEDLKEDYQEQQFIDQNQELILSYFYSLLATAFKATSPNFSEKKGMVWRGISEDNKMIILTVLNEIVQKQGHFSENQDLKQIIEELKPFMDLVNKQQTEISKLLKLKQQEIKDTSEKKIQEKGFTLKKKMAFLNLFSSIILQTIISSEQEGIEQLEELQVLYQQIEKYYEEQITGEKPKKKQKLNTQQEKGASQNTQFIQILVDFLISQLTKPAAYLREVINITFDNFVENIDSYAMETLMSVISRPNEEFVAEMDGVLPEGEEDNEDLIEEEINSEDEQ